MGDIADMMIYGMLCEGCGELLDGDEPGYARYCASCELRGNGIRYTPMPRLRQAPPQPRADNPHPGPCFRCGFNWQRHQRSHKRFSDTQGKKVGGPHEWVETPRADWNRLTAKATTPMKPKR